MIPLRRLSLILPSLLIAAPARADDLPPVSERAARVHAAGLLFDGHNDLPYRLRARGDLAFIRYDLRKLIPSLHTDIPRLRLGGVKAQFWSVFIDSDDPTPARSVTQQIDLVYRMVERYPDVFEIALTADDVERIARSGKIASLIGIEGGVAIENDLAQLRSFARQGARYMTLTHNTTLPWADAATDAPRSDGLSPFGERVVKEMNRLGMLVDISHVSPATMADALRVSKAPLIASHSGAFAVCPVPRNVPDAILDELPRNGGVIMINFFSSFVVPGAKEKASAARAELKAKYPDQAQYEKALDNWYHEHQELLGTVSDVVDHIAHIRKVAGIDHVGIGSDFDGITSTPKGLEDVSGFPRITEELLRRGFSDADVHKVLGGNVLRAFREATKVAEELRKTTTPEVDQPVGRDAGGG